MNRSKFYDILKDLGEFRCAKDLRKFNNQKKQNPKYSISMFLSHFGHCKVGSYHHCDFTLNQKNMSMVGVFSYQRSGERDGQKVRLRSSAFNYFGRGRRWNTNTKKNNPQSN